MSWHRADEGSRRLAKIPGIGPIGAVLLKMKTPEPELFRSGRQWPSMRSLICFGAPVAETILASVHV
jgi:transposase